jgi:superoxide dismutase
MDVWEHAFTGMERPRYIEAFLSNVSWEVVESRLAAAG